MEHVDRAPVATFHFDGALAGGTIVALGEAAAHHARVKRLDVGDPIRVTNGAGDIGAGAVTALRRGALDVAIRELSTIPRQSPIHLRVPVGDRDRMLWVAEKATELGVASWQAVRFRRSLSVSPRGEGSVFAEKVRARMISALEQSGGAWLPEILPDATPDALVVADDELPLVLDVHGAPLLAAAGAARTPVVLSGPEGGIEPDELAMLERAGWVRARLGAATLRFETAGIGALAVLRAAGESPGQGASGVT